MAQTDSWMSTAAERRSTCILSPNEHLFRGPILAAQDISKLSYNELRKLAEEAFALAESKRGEEIKILADAYAKKTTAAGFSVQEAIDALKPYLPMKGRVSKESAVVKYRDPANEGNTYSGRGKHPAWVREYLAAGRKLEEFAV